MHRIVDINTGEILAVADGRGESKRESTSLLGGGGSWHGWGGANVNFGASDFQATIIGEAVKAAVDQMAGGVIAGQGKLELRAAPINGVIAAVEGSQIILNVGSNCGVAVGAQLSVERVSREVKDPTTGQVIRRLSSPVGVVRVVEVDELSAVAVVVSGAGFKVGDVVKSIDK